MDVPTMRSQGILHNPKERRGYTEDDSLLIIIMGVGSSFISALDFGLYISSAEVKLVYRHPNLMWGVVPLILFWQCRLWLATRISRNVLSEEKSFCRSTWYYA